jgi:transposase
MEESNHYKRWTAPRKAEVVIRMLRGESLDALSRELGVEIYLLEEWRTQALQSMESGLKSRANDPLKEELDQAKRRIGELIMENELLEIKARRAPSFRMGRSGK